MQKFNQNTEYELFVKQVYESIINNEGYENVLVKHNIKLQGKSGCKHQIDVYWELKIAGEVQRFAIECKNYSNTIEISKVRDFFGVIYDIGNIKGVMVTKIGFQSGAKLFADFYGVSLKEIRRPKEEDWKGRLRKVQFNVILQTIKLKDVKLSIDGKWLKEKNIDISKSEVNLLSDWNEDIVIYKEDGSKDFDFREMEERIPRKKVKGNGLKYIFDFRKELRLVDTTIGRVKIDGIIVIYDENPISTELIMDSLTITEAIFKDAKSGEMKFIKKKK